MVADRNKKADPETRADAGGVFDLLMPQRTAILAAFLGGLFAALCYLLFIAFADAGATGYRRAVILAANGTAPGTYPNGTRFAPSDLRTGGIVAKVYKNLELGQYGISMAEFDAALWVLPYSPVLEQINLKFRALLAQPSLTLADRAKIEQDYAAALEQNNSFGAVISLDVPNRFSVPPAIAEAVLAAVLNEAAITNVSKLGVAMAAGAIDSAKLVDEASTAAQDLPLALFTLETAQGDLLARTSSMLATPGIADITFGPDQTRLNDIRREAERLGTTEIRLNLAPLANAGIVRDKDGTLRALRSLIQEDQIRIDALQKSIGQIDSLIAQADLFGNRGDTPEGGGASVQLSDATISRLVDLAVENADLGYRRSLFDEKKALGEQASTLNALNQKRRFLAGAIEQQAAAPGPDTDELIGHFANVSAKVAATQNRLWGQLNQLSDLTSGPDSNAQKLIYEDMPLRDPVVASGGLRDRGTWLRALLIFASVVAGGALLQLGRVAIKARA